MEERRDIRKAEGRTGRGGEKTKREGELCQLPDPCGLQIKANWDLENGYAGKLLGAQNDSKKKKTAHGLWS